MKDVSDFSKTLEEVSKRLKWPDKVEDNRFFSDMYTMAYYKWEKVVEKTNNYILYDREYEKVRSGPTDFKTVHYERSLMYDSGAYEIEDLIIIDLGSDFFNNVVTNVKNYIDRVYNNCDIVDKKALFDALDRYKVNEENEGI